MTSNTHWVDYRSRKWRVVQSPRRLKFKYPGHAALRAHVFHRDGYACCRCDARAIDVPDDYTGTEALWTDQTYADGWRVTLIVDHILTLKAGGRSVIENLQALCERCNRKKVKEDNAATAQYLKAGGL